MPRIRPKDRRSWLAGAAAIAAVLLPAALAFAEEAAPPKIDSGDTAWMLTSSALVLMMTAPGLALFYGGLVRGKNVLSVLMQSFILMAVISIQWVVYGYSLAFGPDHGGVVGGLDWFGMNGVGAEPNADYAATIPHMLFSAYQMMFAVITPALITGAFAERMKFSAFLVFSILWATLVYDPLAHMVWGYKGMLGLTGGWGALDFAGGTVVHISSGFSALITAFWLGKRVGFGSDPMPPHNLPFTLVGAALLWVGWFGFNAGSALASNGLAVSAFVATNTGAAAAALTWMLAEWMVNGKPTMLGAASGAVAGLVAITPASGFVTPMASIAIGGVAGVLCWYACSLKMKMKAYDDALDVVGVHCVGGTWGAIATGLFASTAINSVVKTQGLLVSGEIGQVLVQVKAVLITFVLAGVLTPVCLAITSAVCGGIRVDEDDEFSGLDVSQHSENAYVFATGGYETASSSATARGAEKAALRHAEAAQ
jgi:Amt family ammonium transporter